MNERIFRVLHDLALRSPGVVKRQGQVFKIAAAISCRKRGQILATGVNQTKSHPIMIVGGHYKDAQIYLHAEADAIRKAERFLAGSHASGDGRGNMQKFQIHVLRLKRCRSSDTGTWMLGNARPCTGCMNLIHAYGLKEIFWTEDCEINNAKYGCWSQMELFNNQLH